MTAHPLPLPTLTLFSFLSLLSLATGCHEPVTVDETNSATNGDGYFGTSTSGAPDEPAPLDFCRHPVEDGFPGVRFVCAGDFSSTLVFDYHGDPEIPINGYVPCVVHDDKVGLGDGYVYTCYASVYEQPFGLDVAEPYGGDVEACCRAGSPDEFVEDFCRIDAAEEMCIGAAEGLDDLRSKLPVVPKLYELNQQLLNLNEFIATAPQQGECAFTYATKLVDVDAIDGVTDVATWMPDSPKADDADEGWPWLRNIRMNITGFHIDESVETGDACVDLVLPEPEICDGLTGSLVLTSPLGSTKVPLTANLDLSVGDCDGESCPAALHGLAVEVGDLQVGPVSLSSVRAVLRAVATGDAHGDVVAFPRAQIRLGLSMVVAAEKLGIPAGTHVDLDVHPGELRLTRTADGAVGIDSLTLDNWPVSLSASTAPAVCGALH